MRTLLFVLLTLPFLTACGVTERRALTADRDLDQVWAAMKAVAQTPDYYADRAAVGERWILRDNNVAYDDSVRRIEVFRRLERERHQPLSPVTREEREWKFEIVLEAVSPKNGPPAMRFRSRNAGVPSHVWDESRWYFDAVEAFLVPMAPAAATAPSIDSAN